MGKDYYESTRSIPQNEGVDSVHVETGRYEVPLEEGCLLSRESNLRQHYSLPSNLQEFAYMEHVKTINRLAIDNNRAEIADRREILKSNLTEQREENRELTIKKIVEDSDGAILIERRAPSGKCKFSAPVCRERGFRSFIFECKSSGNRDVKVMQIVWFGDETGICVNLKGSGDAKCLIGKFQAKGVAFDFPRRDRKALEDGMLAFFVDRAQFLEVPDHIGWNRLPDGVWIFEPDPKRTLRGLLDE